MFCNFQFSSLLLVLKKTSYSRWLQETIESNRFISSRHNLSEHKPHSMFPRIPAGHQLGGADITILGDRKRNQ